MTGDHEAWDTVVEAAHPGSYLQLSGWARVKAVNGWSAHRLLSEDGAAGRVGAQILVRRPRPLPWGFAYAPRGPVTDAWTPDTPAAFADLVRSGLVASAGRVSHLRIDPELEAGVGPDEDGAVTRALVAAGWRAAPPMPIHNTGAAKGNQAPAPTAVTSWVTTTRAIRATIPGR